MFTYDANGNVAQVIDWRVYGAGEFDPLDPSKPDTATAWHNVRFAARYEYDPFGNVVGPDTNGDGVFDGLSATGLDDSGPYAAANPWRFSTKQFDDATGLGYWGYRYYSPVLGRWINRDPIGERGGRFIAPRRKPGRGSSAGHYQHPDRLRAVHELECEHGVLRAHRRHRTRIEQAFGHLTNLPFGLFALPPVARRRGRGPWGSAPNPARSAAPGPRLLPLRGKRDAGPENREPDSHSDWYIIWGQVRRGRGWCVANSGRYGTFVEDIEIV